MRRRILVLGGSHSDAPLIESSLALGLDVITSGNRPDHPAHWSAHRYCPGDYSNPEEILRLARDQRIDFIVPGANDFAMIAAADVASRLGLPGYDEPDTCLTLHHKHRFKELGTAIGLPVGAHRIVRRGAPMPAWAHYPCIIKPVDLTGGKGMRRVDHPSALPDALAHAWGSTQRDELVIEAWFDGSLHSYSTCIESGEIVFEYFDNEYCHHDPFLVSTSASHCTASADAQSIVRQRTRALVRALRLRDGVLHCQFLASPDDIRILEYTRRMSGDLYSTVVQQVRGLRHADLFVRTACGLPAAVSWERHRTTRRHIARHCITSSSAGRFRTLNVSEPIRSQLVSLTLGLRFGSAVAGDGKGKVATAILEFDSSDRMLRFARDPVGAFDCGVEHDDSL